MLNWVSDIPVYCLLQRMHSSRYIKYLLLQLYLQKMLKFCLVTLLVYVVILLTFIRHRFPDFIRQRLKLSIFLDLLLVCTAFFLKVH